MMRWILWISYEDKTLLQAEDNFYINGVCDINDGKESISMMNLGHNIFIL